MESIQAAQILIPNGIRLMIFDYFSTKQLLVKVSALSKKTRTQLFSSPIKRDTNLKIPTSKVKASVLSLINLSKNITIVIDADSNLYNLHYILTSIPENLQKDHITLNICNFALELVNVLGNFEDYTFEIVNFSQVDSQDLEKLQIKCNALVIAGINDLKMSQIAKFDQRNKLKTLIMLQCTLENDLENYKFERIIHMELEETEINLDLSNHFDFSLFKIFVYDNNTEYQLAMMIANLSQLKEVGFLYLTLQLTDLLDYQQVLRSLATNEKIINELRFSQDEISIKLSDILQEYPIKLIKDGQLNLNKVTVDNLYVGDQKFKGKIIKGYENLNIISLDYFMFSESQNIKTKIISIKIKDEETGNLLLISAFTGEIELPQNDDDE